MRGNSRALATTATVFLWLGFPAACAAQSWVLTGSVVDRDGVGIADVDIDITDASGTPLSLSGDLTGAAGDFTTTILDSVPTGLYDIELNPPDGSGFGELLVTGVFLFDSADLGEFTLYRRWSLTGRVTAEDGAAHEGIDLEFFDVSGVEVEVPSDNTDVLGDYSVTLDEGIWDIEFRQVDPGYVTYVPVRFDDRDIAGDTVIDVVLREGFSVTGSVEDGAGAPVAGADLDVSDPSTGTKIHMANDDSDTSGAFTLLVPAGTWDFVVTPPAGMGLAAKRVGASVAAAPAVNDLGVIVLPDGIEVTGRAVDSSAVGAAGVDLDFVVSATGTEVAAVNDDSDARGTFATTVEAGTYDIQFRPPFATGLAPVVLDATEVVSATDLGDVTLPAGFALTGLVTDGTDPVADVLVTLAQAATGGAVYVFGNRTAANGGYALRAESGTYDVTFTPPIASGLQAVTVTDFELGADSVLDAQLGDGRPPPADPEFIRGDSNGDGAIDISDPIRVLSWQFADGVAPPCLKAADFNDGGGVDIADAIAALSWLFSDGFDPAPPHPRCGADPTADSLSCALPTPDCP